LIKLFLLVSSFSAEYCLPLVRVGGLFVAAKGHDPQEEVRNAERAIQMMGASLLQLCSGIFVMFSVWHIMCIIMIEKWVLDDCFNEIGHYCQGFVFP
jgi:hypothetical protein